MFPMNRKSLAVAVEYDCRGSRAVKGFADAYAARRFYAAKYKAGRNPKVVSAATSLETE